MIKSLYSNSLLTKELPIDACHFLDYTNGMDPCCINKEDGKIYNFNYSSINLRTGSSSAKTSNTKFTIDIAIKNNNRFNRRLSNLKSGTNIEIKFEN